MLVPLPKYSEKKVTDYQTVTDIVRQMIEAVKNSYSQAKKIYEILKSKSNSTFELIKNTWLLSKKIITYNKEPINKQSVKEFSRIYHDKYGDCKHFSIFIACILFNDEFLKDKLYFEIVDTGKGRFTHVFVTVKNIPVDGTSSDFGIYSNKIIRSQNFKIK